MILERRIGMCMVRWMNYSHKRFSFTPGLPDDNSGVIVLIGFPVNAPEGTPITFGNNASADWKLYFNSWQLELGYDYFISKAFSIRPHMGVQASWIRQYYDQDFHNVIIATTSNPYFYGILSTRSKLRRWGLGPRVGIEGNCHIGWGFSLQGISSIALLYGQFDNQYRRHIESVNTLAVGINVSNSSPYRLRANAQLSFGLEWAYCFCQNYLLAFNAAYEAQYWWDQMELFTLYNLLTTGDLTFQRLDFRW